MTDGDLASQQVGRFRIVSLIGRGGMGAVYRAIDTTLERPVAVKVLPPELTGHSDRLQRFIQEAKTASALNHPHLVSVYEVGSDVVGGETVHYMAMELVEGETLRQRAAGRSLDLRRSLQVMSQVADAVAAAHAVGITHRDLKPDNIMISSSGYAKVLDFGLAKLRIATGDESRTAVKGTDPGLVMGTVGYMSPEQAQGKEADARSDVFSMGCILYELVTGHRAFEGDSTVDTLHKILHSQPLRLASAAPDAPLELQRIVAKALEKDPEERYQSVKDLAIDLRRLLREVESNPDLVTVSTPSGGHAIVQSGRNAMPWIVGAIAIVAIAAVAMVFLRTRRGAPDLRPSIKIQRITSLGKVISATISPDAKLVAYVVSEQGVQSLWVRQLATGRDLQLLAPDRVAFWSHTFTPDGSSIVYGLRSLNDIAGAFHQISILGGPSRRLLSGIDSPPSFSPDGKRFTYVRERFPTPDESALMIANADGSEPHAIATRKKPVRFAPIFFTGPAWSHDGSLIAVAENAGEGAGARAIGVDPATGKESVLSAGWAAMSQLAWLPDDSGLIATASSGLSQMAHDNQIWSIPRSGKPVPVTNDLLDYRIVSLSSDGRALVSVATDGESTVWKVALDGKAADEKLTQEKLDGIAGVALVPDGLVYTGMSNGHMAVFRRRNGSAQELVSGDVDARHPAVPADGRFVVYVAVAPAGLELRRADLGDTHQDVVLVKSVDNDFPDVSPDGKRVVFTSGSRLWRVSSDGGAATPLTPPAERYELPAFSPDGNRLAAHAWTADGPRIVVMNAETGAVQSTLPAEPTGYGSTLRWSPDGSGLLVNRAAHDLANVWFIPFKGEPRRLTSYSEKMSGPFVVSPDGKSLILSRIVNTRDAVLITNFQ